jgi:hypothetical protein
MQKCSALYDSPSLLYFLLMNNSFHINMGVKSMPLLAASKLVSDIFHITGVNDNGKPTMRCSRCEGFEDKERGKGFVLLSVATTKAKEHIAVYCPGILPNENSCDANLRHTLLINLPRGILSTISKAGLAMRKCYLLCVSFYHIVIFLTTALTTCCLSIYSLER